MEAQIISFVGKLPMYVMEHPRAKGEDGPILDHALTCNNLKMENIRYDAPLGKNYHAVLGLEYMVTEEITKKSDRKSSPKMSYRPVNYTVKNFWGDIDLKRELHCQIMERFKKVSEIYSKGVCGWIPVEGRKKKASGKRDMV